MGWRVSEKIDDECEMSIYNDGHVCQVFRETSYKVEGWAGPKCLLGYAVAEARWAKFSCVMILQKLLYAPTYNLCATVYRQSFWAIWGT